MNRTSKKTCSKEWKCKLHVDKVYDDKEKVIPFTTVTLGNWWKKKELRIKTQKRLSKYDQVDLPMLPDGESGYHAQCHKYFCSISEKTVKVPAPPSATTTNGRQIIEINREGSSNGSAKDSEVTGGTGIIAENIADSIADNIEDDITGTSNDCVFCSKQLRRRNGITQNLIQVGTSDMKLRIY